MLGDALVLDGSKYSGSLRFGNIKTEFFGLQDNGVEPAFLSQNNLPPCADQVGRKWLDRFRDMKLARHGAAFAHEKILADGRLPRFKRITAGALNKLRDSANPGKVKRDQNVVKTAEGESDFAKVGVACAFAHAVDGPLNPGSAGANGCDRASGGHAKIVVAVKMDGDARTNPLADLANEILDSFRTASADRVDNDDFSGARFQRSEINLFQKFRVGARAVNGEKRNANGAAFGEGNGVMHARENFIAAYAVRTEFDIARGGFYHRGSEPEANELFNVSLNGAGKTPELGAEAGLEHELDGFGIVRGDAGGSCFDATYAESVELTSNFELLPRRQDDTDGLLAIAKSRIVKMNGGTRKDGADFGAGIEFTDPDARVLKSRHNPGPSGRIPEWRVWQVSCRKLFPRRSPDCEECRSFLFRTPLHRPASNTTLSDRQKTRQRPKPCRSKRRLQRCSPSANRERGFLEF